MNRIVALALVTLVLAATAWADEDAEALLRRARQLEEERQLDAAMEGYRALWQRYEQARAVGGQAMYRMGRCHQQAGRAAEARECFTHVAKFFADREELAAAARKGLAELEAAQPGREAAALAERAALAMRASAMAAEAEAVARARDQERLAAERRASAEEEVARARRAAIEEAERAVAAQRREEEGAGREAEALERQAKVLADLVEQVRRLTERLERLEAQGRR